MSWKGTLRRVDLGAGGWSLELADGQRFTLVGDVPAGLEGRSVRVEGQRASSMGFLMTGDGSIDVRSVRPL